MLDDCFMINDIKIIQGRDSLFISMPSRRKKNGEFKDVAHPLNNETRRWIEERVLAEFHRAIEGAVRRARGNGHRLADTRRPPGGRAGAGGSHAQPARGRRAAPERFLLERLASAGLLASLLG